MEYGQNGNLNQSERSAKHEAISYFMDRPTAFAALEKGNDDVQATTEPGRQIVGVGFGLKVESNRSTTTKAVRIYTETKIPLSELDEADRVPPFFGDYPTDVVDIGEISLLNQARTWQKKTRLRPCPGGVSIGHFSTTAGTFGCLVTNDSGDIFILSNNHVLAATNQAQIGDPIFQPGPSDGGTSNDEIATLKDFIRININQDNEIDAAIAIVEETGDVETYIVGIGKPTKQIKPAQTYMSVRKHGRTTGATLGIVEDVSATIFVRVSRTSRKRARFVNQIGISGFNGAFSQPGDSGSLVVDAVSNAPVGLLFAGGNGTTFANPIDTVLNAFNVSIYP